MDFEFSDEQAMLREVFRDTLRDHSSPEKVRAIADGGLDVDPKLWSLGAELGWTGLAIPEQYGGAGQGLVELCIAAEELGRAITPGPFITTSLVGLAVARHGSAELQAEVLPGLADGSTPATWALAEPRRGWAPESIQATAVLEGDTVLLNGRKTAVQDAGSAAWLLVLAVLDGEPTSFLVERTAGGMATRRQKVLDQTRSLYEVRLENVRVPAARRLAGGAEQVRWLSDAAAVLTSADSLGVGERLLEMTVDYVNVRVQFDRPIGSFQAVKHKCSDMLMLVRGVRAATYYAAMAFDAGTPDASRAASVAKAFSSEAMSRVAGEALQTHGGIGFTWEHDLHLYLRRAKTDEALYGDAAVHQRRLCSLLAAEGAGAR